jgi:hypothetical protein
MKMVKAICVLACCAGVSLVAAGCKTEETKKEATTGTTKDPETGGDTRGMNTDAQAADGTTQGGDATANIVANMR